VSHKSSIAPLKDERNPPRTPDVDERIRIEQHHVRDLAGFDRAE